MGVAGALAIACWIGFRDRRPPSPSGISGLQRSNAPEQQIPFAPAERVVANRTSKPQTALGREPGERKIFSTMPPEVLDGNIRVRYFSDDVTVRYFTLQPPPQWVPDRNSLVRHISEDVTVRYFPPEPGGSPPSTPNASSPRSVSR